MAQFEIEYDIPMPEAGSNGGRGGKYPWRDMKVGGSFFVPGEHPPSPPPKLKEAGQKFKSRASEKDGTKGFRVWRVE